MMINTKLTAFFAAGAILCGSGLFAADAKVAEAPKADALKVEAPKDIFASVPAVVAEVKGQKITKDMLVADIMKMFPDGKIPEQITAEEIQRSLPGIVKAMVIKRLFEEELAKAGIKPSPELLRQRLTEDIKNMSPDELEGFKEDLKMRNQTQEQRIDEISKDPMMQEQYAALTYLEKNVYKDIKVDKNVTPEMVQKFYDENKDKFKEPVDKPDQIRASHILIAFDPFKEGDKKAEAEAEKKALAKAKEILALIKKDPKIFEEMAKDNSACPSKARGGSLGAFDKGAMVPEFEAAALGLKDNEISAEPVKTKFGYHIIRRDALQLQESAIPFERMRGEIEEFLKFQKMQEEQQQQAKVRDEFFSKLEKDNQVKYFVEMPADVAQ